LHPISLKKAPQKYCFFLIYAKFFDIFYNLE